MNIWNNINMIFKCYKVIEIILNSFKMLVFKEVFWDDVYVCICEFFLKYNSIFFYLTFLKYNLWNNFKSYEKSVYIVF